MTTRHRAKKSLGQNFILDPSIANRIVSYAGDIDDFDIVEIGPGLGTMTECVLKKNPRKLIAIEKDDRLKNLHHALEKKYKNYRCIFGDVLEINLLSIVASPTKIISNLPYNISVIFLLRILPFISAFQKLILMLQKEVVDRIVAVPGTKNYSILSVLVQLLCDVQRIEDFPPEIFTPSPKVHSSVVDISPLQASRFPVDYSHFVMMLRNLFKHKRKTIRNSLNAFIDNVDELLKQCNILPSERAENLSIQQLCNMSNILCKNART